jgi:L-asparaginase
LNIYATGNEAAKLGMISGNDMTCESAVAKLSFLASKKLSFEELKNEMIKNYRG